VPHGPILKNSQHASLPKQNSLRLVGSFECVLTQKGNKEEKGENNKKKQKKNKNEMKKVYKK
jgi:hypothetical protein